jgi:hypothetical protein
MANLPVEKTTVVIYILVNSPNRSMSAMVSRRKIVPSAEELSTKVKEIIDTYIDGHRSRSIATLARASGVSYTTLRRFAQKEGQPTAEPVLKIADTVLKPEEKLSFVSKFFPEIASTFRLEHDETRLAESYPESFKTFFNRDPYNFILNLAHNDKGVTYEDINRLCGTKGLEAFQELIDQQILKCDDTDKSPTYRLGASISNHCDFGLMQVKLSADHFDRKLIGTKAARLFHATASLTPDALIAIHSLITTCIHDILKLKDDPKNSGNIPFFADFLMNVYDRSTVENIKEICSEPN